VSSRHTWIKWCHYIRSCWDFRGCPRVTDSDRAAFERQAQTETFDGFKITEQDASGQFVTAARRPEYFPIYYSGFQADVAGVVVYDVDDERPMPMPEALRGLELRCADIFRLLEPDQ
jgi:hypothetical protein